MAEADLKGTHYHLRREDHLETRKIFIGPLYVTTTSPTTISIKAIDISVETTTQTQLEPNRSVEDCSSLM
jgi:hypothetical protein